MPATIQPTPPEKTVKPAKKMRSRIQQLPGARCKECQKELRKNEGDVCDECRLQKMGWKKA